MAAPKDAVHLDRYEDTTTGGDDADMSGVLGAMGPLDPHEDAPYVQGLFIVSPTPGDGLDKLVYVSRDASGNMTFKDIVDGTERTLSDLLAGVGGGISEAQHEALDTLNHNIVETSYEEYVYTGNRVDDIIIWTNNTKTTKIREINFTYSGSLVTTIVTKQYDGGGTLVDTITETLNYTGNKLDDIDRVNS